MSGVYVVYFVHIKEFIFSFSFILYLWFMASFLVLFKIFGFKQKYELIEEKQKKNNKKQNVERIFNWKIINWWMENEEKQKKIQLIS